MFDNLYSLMEERIHYKKLMLFPIIITIIMIILISTRGVPLGLDFAGGSWVEITLEKEVNKSVLSAIKEELKDRDLEHLNIFSGVELGTNLYKITISTTTVVNETEIKNILEKYVGELRREDIAEIRLSEEPSADIEEKLRNRIKGADIIFDGNESILRIIALDINPDMLKRATELYIKENIDIDLQKKNFRIEKIGKTLGDKFWKQGMYAVIFAYLLIVAVIFLVFKDFIPSIAIIAAATFDAIFAVGGMSIFGLLLEPASLVSLLMLIGYSVDSDILLTTRVLRTSKGTVNERIDSAMKTGLTMTGTTMGAMVVILIFTNTLIRIPALPNIASVLLIGLIADLINTWLLNAGILKWYVEEKGGRFDILKSIKKRKWM